MSDDPCICPAGHYHSSVAMAALCQPTGEKQEKRYSLNDLRALAVAWDIQAGPFQKRELLFAFLDWVEEREIP